MVFSLQPKLIVTHSPTNQAMSYLIQPTPSSTPANSPRNAETGKYIRKASVHEQVLRSRLQPHVKVDLIDRATFDSPKHGQKESLRKTAIRNVSCFVLQPRPADALRVFFLYLSLTLLSHPWPTLL